MTTYNTQNPLGSADPRDLYDNAENADRLINGQEVGYPDRLGNDRLSWAGMEQAFQDFLLASGYEDIGPYAADLQITARNQIFLRSGEYYKPSASLSLPYVTTGDWANEGVSFVSAGDAALRQELSNNGGEIINVDSSTGNESLLAALNRRGVVFDSIASMKNSTGLNIGARVRTLGYYSPGDGGGNDYEIVSQGASLDDGGAFIDLAEIGAQAKALFSNGTINIKQFGAIGNSNATPGSGFDNHTAISNAIEYVGGQQNSYELLAPEGVYRISSSINVFNEISIVGQGVSPYKNTLGELGSGTWFFLDHSDKGFFVGGISLLSGVELKNFGIKRHHDEPSSAWIPNDDDYDIYIDNADIYLENIIHKSSARGIYLTNGNAGRLHASRVRGHWFKKGIVIDESYDVIRLDDIHAWPFWKDNSDIHAYTRQNLDVINLNRCDNPLLSDCFSIFARSFLRISQNSIGTTNKVHLSNGDADRGAIGIWVDSSVSAGASGQFDNFTHQGEDNYVGSKMIHVEGDNSVLDFGNVRTDYCDQNAIRVDGLSNIINLSGATELYNFNGGVAGFPGIELTSTNLVKASHPIINGGRNGANIFGGSGLIQYIVPNRGKVTLNGGVASVTVAHNLSGITPSDGQIMIVPLTGMAGSSDFWVGNYTSTTFTIFCNPAPSSNIEFAWRACLD